MTEYRVTAPVKGFKGEIGGVGFHKGVATVEGEQKAELAYFRRKGFLVEEIKPVVEAPPEATKVPTESAGEEAGKEVNDSPASGAEVPKEAESSPSSTSTAKGGKKK